MKRYLVQSGWLGPLVIQMSCKPSRQLCLLKCSLLRHRQSSQTFARFSQSKHLSQPLDRRVYESSGSMFRRSEPISCTSAQAFAVPFLIGALLQATKARQLSVNVFCLEPGQWAGSFAYEKDLRKHLDLREDLSVKLLLHLPRPSVDGALHQSVVTWRMFCHCCKTKPNRHRLGMGTLGETTSGAHLMQCQSQGISLGLFIFDGFFAILL